jgi:hypothetical protein
MEEFKLATKKNQVVYYVELNVIDGVSRTNLYKDGLTVKELKIVHQTPFKIVLSDDFVTILDRQKKGERKESYKRFLDDVTVNIKTHETYFPNGVFSRCYTTQEPKKMIREMKHKIINEINKNYGFLRTVDIERKIYDMEILP